MGWPVNADEHSVDCRARRHAKGHGDMTARPRVPIVRYRSCDGESRGDDDVFSIEMAPASFDPPTPARTNLCNPRVLENSSPRPFDCRGKSDQVSYGIELSLPAKSQCAGGFKRQRSLRKHIGVKAEA